ncbi:hypothetical protein Nmel_006424 [Mimus melanotis]
MQKQNLKQMAACVEGGARGRSSEVSCWTLTEAMR